MLDRWHLERGPDRFVAYQREAFKPIQPGQIGKTVSLEPVILAIEGVPVEIAPIDDTDTKMLLNDSWSADLVAMPSMHSESKYRSTRGTATGGVASRPNWRSGCS